MSLKAILTPHDGRLQPQRKKNEHRGRFNRENCQKLKQICFRLLDRYAGDREAVTGVTLDEQNHGLLL